MCPFASALADEAKEPTKLTMKIEVSSDVNPDQSGRASPIKVRIYELKDTSSFMDADYFTLDSSDKTLLASDMLAKDEFILKPGESRIIERDSKSQTVAVGVLAGYRELEKVTWRAIYKLKEAPEQAWYRKLIPSNKAKLNIQMMPQGVILVEQ
ncbi:type VI secretion system lipoprotein TssJ [Methylovorus sp. MP688]|uniref:type VI secretion system lipoprotein TssJ n=1 Tax=Methylovorus sp. (strain MP688) TaxID=887061 RepID=UPI0026F3A6B3|nr:type VI secretion system lipoprotein TssJ [Methylovorus sp. MP688]